MEYQVLKTAKEFLYAIEQRLKESNKVRDLLNSLLILDMITLEEP